MNRFTFTSLKHLCLLLLVFGAFSCDDDTAIIPGPSVVAPSTNLGTSGNFVSTSATVTAGEVFSVQLNGTSGDADMRDIEALEAGSRIDATRLTIDGDFGQNPLLLTGTNTSSYTLNYDITAHTDGSTKTYSFITTATDGSTSEESVSITVEAVSNPPTMELTNGTGNNRACPAEGFVFRFTGATGGANLSTMSVTLDDGSFIPISQVSYFLDSGTQAWTDNPELLPSENQTGFTDLGLLIRAPSETTGTFTYNVTVTDDSGQTASVPISFTIDVTPAGASASDKVYNNAGAEFGGFDLDNLVTVSSTNDAADFVDAGNGGGAWLREIVPDNIDPAELRSINTDTGCQVDALAFEDIVYAAQIENAYNSGTAISSTGTLNVGSRFTASVNGNIYFVEVAEIDQTGSANDTEFYTLKVKRSR